MERPVIYLDHQASTPLDPRVQSAMSDVQDLYGNPHSTSHLAGIEANRAVSRARRHVAAAIGGETDRVVFTSGATEANNLALLGFFRARTGPRKLVTVVSEHSSVLEPAISLRNEGVVVEILRVDSTGLVDLENLEQAVDAHTCAVSVMYVNNETSVMQPIAEIAQICHKVGAILHTDCAQALGRVEFNVEALGADLITLSSHKSYGPKGIGALYISGKNPIELKPIFVGGGQEGGLRPGTVPVPLCVGFGEACHIVSTDLPRDQERMKRLGESLIRGILQVYPRAQLNGSQKDKAPGAFNICFRGSSATDLLVAFDGIQVSSGSACTSTEIEPSRVLLSYGLSRSEADASLRFSIGRFTTPEEVEEAVKIVDNGIRMVGLNSSSLTE